MQRYIVLTASILTQMCLGGIYAWSSFVAPLRSGFGLTAAQTQIIFGITFAAFTITMIFAGRAQERTGPRLAGIIGGLLFGLGYLIASYSGGSFWLLLTGIGIIGGMAIGCCYVCPLATCVKWFPKNKGLITGLAVAGFGAGAIVLSSASNMLFNEGLSVLEVFRVVGITYGAILVLCAATLKLPEDQIRLEQKSRISVSIGNLVRQKEFQMLAIGMFSGTFAGLMIVGNIKSIGTTSGLEASQASLAIAAFAAGNAVGRVCWGSISDKIGRRTIPLSLFALCLAVILLVPASPSTATFILVAAMTGFGFGACFVVYAAQVAATYGPAAVGSVYPLIFLFYGLSGITGPLAGGLLFDLTKSYALPSTVAMAVTFSGAMLTALIIRRTPEITSSLIIEQLTIEKPADKEEYAGIR